MKRLDELNPKFGGALRKDSGETLEADCPKCGPTHRLLIMFSNPLDGGAAPVGMPLWKRTGDSFKNLTVEPSVHYPACFHGWIENGVVFDISESPLTVLSVVGGIPKPVALSPRQTVEVCTQALERVKELLKQAIRPDDNLVSITQAEKSGFPFVRIGKKARMLST